MATCDEYPEFFFPDDEGNFPWDYAGWGDDEITEEKPDYFDTFQEAKVYATNNPGVIFTRSRSGTGYVLKGTF